MFEVGEVVIPDEKPYNRNRQVINLAAATIGENVNLNKIKSELDIFFKLLQKEVKYKAISHPAYLEGRVFSVSVNKKNIGIFGEINPEIILKFKLKQPIVALELNIVQQFPEIEFYI